MGLPVLKSCIYYVFYYRHVVGVELCVLLNDKRRIVLKYHFAI